MRLSSGKNYTLRVRKLQPKLIFLSTKNIRTKNLTNQQRTSERDYFGKQFDLQIHDMGKNFKAIRMLLDKDARINVCNTVDFIIDNRLVCDYNVISNTFSYYFISIGNIFSNRISCNVNPLLYVDNISNSIVIPNISQEAVISVMKSLKNSAPGYDDIPTSVMKKYINENIAPLTYLVNNYIIQGIFPDEFKIVKVFQIFKSNENILQTYTNIYYKL